MYIGLEKGWQELRSAVCVLASGELLLYKKGEVFYFSTDAIYCNYAGYITTWKNFIGYQNIIFYRELEKLRDIAYYGGGQNIVYEEKKWKDFLERGKAFGVDYICFEGVEFIEYINKTIEQAKYLYEKIKKVRSKEQLTSFFKKELDSRLPVFYADLMFLKALLQPRFVDNNFFITAREKILNSENILAVWKANEVR